MTRLSVLVESPLPKALFNSPNINGDPPLCYILSCTELEDWNTGEVIEAMDLLVDIAGASVNTCDGTGNTVLHLAAARGDMQLLEKCLLWTKERKGKNPDDKIDIDMQNVDASKYSDGNWSKVESSSLQGKSNEKVQKSEIEILNDTPLNVAIKEEHEECALRLLEAGANVHIPDACGDTALVCALENEMYDVAAACIAKGAKVNVESKSLACQRLMHHYASHGNMLVLRMVMDSPGFDVDELLNEPRGSHGFTPLHCAARGGKLEACQLLVERGASIYAVDCDGATPADLAELNKKTEVADWLKSKAE